MPDPSNNSFIPKRGPASHSKRGTGSRRVYIFSIISYVLMFATLLAAGGMFMYTKVLDKQLNEEVAALNTEIGSFSKANMQKVLDFNERLEQASSRLNTSVSMVSIFRALEAATIDTVMIDDLVMQRDKDDKYILTASIYTDSFDSTIFQRGEFQRNQTITSVVLSSVNAAAGGAAKENVETTGTDPLVTFSATLEIPVSAVPYDPSVQSSVPTFIGPPVTDLEIPEEEDESPEAVSDVEANNEETI